MLISQQSFLERDEIVIFLDYQSPQGGKKRPLESNLLKAYMFAFMWCQNP